MQYHVQRRSNARCARACGIEWKSKSTRISFLSSIIKFWQILGEIPSAHRTVRIERYASMSSRVGESPIDSRVAINKLVDNSCSVIVVGVKMATSFWRVWKGGEREGLQTDHRTGRGDILYRAPCSRSLLQPTRSFSRDRFFFAGIANRLLRLSLVENAFPSVFLSRRKRLNRKQVATVLDDKTIARVPLETWVGIIFARRKRNVVSSYEERSKAIVKKGGGGTETEIRRN